MAHKSPMLHSIYDLTTFCRETTGDIPPNLIGASTTVVGSKMYLFGGRLVEERRIVANLYVFDMVTFVWERIPNIPEGNAPPPRYFHSADTWNDHLIVFGGMSMNNKPDVNNPDELYVLNDTHIFNFTTRRWIPASTEPGVPVPRSRYAHLSSVTGDKLFIVGGQDFHNTWLDDICIFNLVTQTWTQQYYPRHCGTYRSVAVSSPTVIRTPQGEINSQHHTSTLGPPGKRFLSTSISGPPPDTTPSENLIHLPYLAAPTENHPSGIYLYSNYNFTDVKRELEVFTPLSNGEFIINDRSPAMTGPTFPPGLRFPTGAILGTHLIIAGTYLAHSYQSFSIWALDLTSMAWSRIDPGKAIETGSWFRGCLHAAANRFIVFGNRHGNLVDDYNRRLLSWNHIAVVDLEAFGIYQPPPLKLDLQMQELGLASLEERVLTDFEIICEDGQRIPCSRRILEERWPWFKEQRKLFLEKVSQTTGALPTSPMHLPLPELPGTSISGEARVDPRLTPRSLYLSEPYPIALAFLQYIYSLALITSLQHMPGVLGQLLILATSYQIPHLESLVKHAMHQALTNPNSVGVYEVTTLCRCRSLQIRALKTVMAYTQKRPSRRSDKEGGASQLRHANSTGGKGLTGSNSSSSSYVSRPRGTSDAAWENMANKNGFSSSDYNYRNNQYRSVASSSRQSRGPIMATSLSESAVSASENGHTISPGLVSADVSLSASSQPFATRPGLDPNRPPKPSKPVANLFFSVNAKTSTSIQSPGIRTPTLTINTAIPTESRSNSGHTISPQGSGLIPPMLSRIPRRPTTGVSQSSSSEDIRGHLMNRKNADPLLPSVRGHAKQSSISRSSPLHQRNQHQHPKKVTLSSPSPLLPPLLPSTTSSEPRFSPVGESATFPPSQLPFSDNKSGESLETRDDMGNTVDPQSVYRQKQAPVVHWITPETAQSSDSPIGVTSTSSKPSTDT